MTLKNKHDFQKTKVYYFEEEIAELHGVSGEQLTLRECQSLVNGICSLFAVHPPEVTDGRGCRHAYASTLWIRLPRCFRNLVGVVHECCHVIIDTLNDNDVSDHGPLFVRYFIEILHRFRSDLSVDHLEELALIEKVEVAPSETFRMLASTDAKKILSLFLRTDETWENVQSLENLLETASGELEQISSEADEVIQVARAQLFPENFGVGACN